MSPNASKTSAPRWHRRCSSGHSGGLAIAIVLLGFARLPVLTKTDIGGDSGTMKMARFTKALALVVGVIILALVGWVAYWLHMPNTPSNILDFHPRAFQAKAEKAEARFFYSIGNELKNDDYLNSGAPTLLRGEIRNFLVSPDGTEIAVVADGVLTVIGRDGMLVRQVAHVDSIYREPKPIGRNFYRDDDFQWARDSKSLYLIRDEYYQSKGSQLFSEKGELWRYDVPTGSMQRVLSPFPAFNYFFGLGPGIYFSVPTKSGDLQLRYFDGKDIRDVSTSGGHEIPTGGLSGSAVESPFFSFSVIDYQDVVLPAKGVALVTDEPVRLQRLVIRSKPYLTLTQGEGLKGPYYCLEMLGSVFLPGDRYFLLNADRCGNYNGQLLIDTETGQYARLPSDTRAYLVLNTDSGPRYRITGGGIVAK